MGKTSKRRPEQVSNEELDLRWAYYRNEIDITEVEMKKRIEEIRQKTGKP